MTPPISLIDWKKTLPAFIAAYESGDNELFSKLFAELPENIKKMSVKELQEFTNQQLFNQ